MPTATSPYLNRRIRSQEEVLALRQNRDVPADLLDIPQFLRRTADARTPQAPPRRADPFKEECPSESWAAQCRRACAVARECNRLLTKHRKRQAKAARARRRAERKCQAKRASTP